jgi:hypothetical protein
MASISSSTTHKVTKTVPKKVATPATSAAAPAKAGAKKVLVKKVAAGKGKVGALSTPRGMVPKLKPKELATDAQVTAFQSLSEADQLVQIKSLVQRAQGERPFHLPSAPTAASTTADRGFAAADLAVAAKTLGCHRVLKGMGVLAELERALIPNGIGAVFTSDQHSTSGGMSRIMSSVSLASMDSMGGLSDAGGMESSATVASTEKGKSTPAAAREGCLLLMRALCETCGRVAEPYVVPLLAAALDESASSQGMVREASEDCCKAIIKLANPHAFEFLISPVLFEALKSPEWRVKCNSMDRLAQLASTAPLQVCALLPKLIPIVSQQVWDTKPQVSKAAGACLLATCHTNVNPDIRPTIPAVVQAIVKPSDTVMAIEELMGTTFVSTVDASTLALLCPVLSRGLKEKMALHKRATCLVISNMSRLVETPEAVAPFGPLLVPELKKVAENVQFEEIRDAALKALQTLTKALGHASIEEAVSSVMAVEQQKVEEEQQRIKAERDAVEARERAIAEAEAAERRQWKEAQEASRLLEDMRIKEESELKAEENRKAEKDKRSVKEAGGKCKGCGLKKCRKDCLFRS